MKTILFAASEGLPFIKSGGLADVVGSLPKVLKAKGNDVRIVLPMYDKIARNNRQDFKKLHTFPVVVGLVNTVASVYETSVEGVPYYFIEHAGYFERDGLYGYPDDGERFAFYQKAILEMLPLIGFFPNIIHSHDWHTGMLGAMCKIQYAGNKKMAAIKHVYTIHNLAFQGNFPQDTLYSCLGFDQRYFNDGTMRFHDGISFMKTGVIYSDVITTVSPTYSKEILTEQYGEQMNDILHFRKDDLYGVVNGIDVDMWNPLTDTTLACNYDVKNFAEGKCKNKEAVQNELGLRVARDVMMIGIVSRLTWQKGVYLVIEKLQEIMGMDIQLVILGTGEAHIEGQFKSMENNFKRRAVYYCGYNEELAHKIYAGCDLFLMPSLFEPCGIGQLIAMHYGTLPVVRETGGLKDTVIPYNQFSKEGTGFSFAPFNSHDMMVTLHNAAEVYYSRPEDWKQLITQAMESDVSWDQSAKEYIDIYNKL